MSYGKESLNATSLALGERYRPCMPKLPSRFYSSDAATTYLTRTSGDRETLTDTGTVL
jgi:hypothetical protein